jgi:hypothetical protein
MRSFSVFFAEILVAFRLKETIDHAGILEKHTVVIALRITLKQHPSRSTKYPFGLSYLTVSGLLRDFQIGCFNLVFASALGIGPTLTSHRTQPRFLFATHGSVRIKCNAQGRRSVRFFNMERTKKPV